MERVVRNCTGKDSLSWAQVGLDGFSTLSGSRILDAEAESWLEQGHCVGHKVFQVTKQRWTGKNRYFGKKQKESILILHSLTPIFSWDRLFNIFYIFWMFLSSTDPWMLWLLHSLWNVVYFMFEQTQPSFVSSAEFFIYYFLKWFDFPPPSPHIWLQ